MSLFVISQSIVILMVALYVLYKGVDIVLVGLKQFGSALGLRAQYYGAVLIGMVSALPVLAIALTSVFFGQSLLVVPTIMGANITILLLIGGMVALMGGSIVLWDDFLKTALPVFCITTVLFVMSVLDGMIDRLESLLLLSTFCIYISYIYFNVKKEHAQLVTTPALKSVTIASFLYVLIGIIALLVGAKFSIDMASTIATALSIPLPLLCISVLAFGASVPSLLLVLQALKRKDLTFALGIIIGSSVLSLLVASGLAGMWSGNLVVSDIAINQGVPMVVVASIVIFVSSLSKHFMRPVGMMMLMLFLFFLLKLGAYIG